MDRDPLYTLQIVKKKGKKKAYLPTLIFLVMLPQPDIFFLGLIPITACKQHSIKISVYQITTQAVSGIRPRVGIQLGNCHDRVRWSNFTLHWSRNTNYHTQIY